MFSLRDDASPYRWMGSALINGRKPVMRIAASPDDEKNKFDAIALTDIYGGRGVTRMATRKYNRAD